MTTVYLLDLFAVFVFGLSGALAADRQRMDLFGFVVIALLPGIGGGTLRDVIIDAPVFWLTDPAYLLMTLLAALLTFLAANLIERTGTWLAWADAVGLALFCVIGASKTLTLGHSPAIATMMGVITAVAGGMLRDIVCNEVPLILREEVYATAAFAGAAAYVGLIVSGVPAEAGLWIGALIAFAVRGAGLIWHLSLPKRGAPPTD